MKKMTKIYQLMIGKNQINDHYDRDDVAENAMQLTLDTGMSVSIRVADEIEGVPADWTTLVTFCFD